MIGVCSVYVICEIGTEFLYMVESMVSQTVVCVPLLVRQALFVCTQA